MMMERNTPPLFFETWRALLFLIHSINWSIMLSGFIDVWRYTKIKIVQILFSRSYSSYQLFPAPSSLHRLTGMHPWHQGNWSSLFFPPLAPHLCCHPTSVSIFPQLNFHFTSTIALKLCPYKAVNCELALSAEYDKGLFYVPGPYISCA